MVFAEESSALKEKKDIVIYEYTTSNDQLKKFKLLFSIWFSVKHYFNIRSLITTNKIEIVHIHNFFPLLTPSIFLAAKHSGAKVILTLHNYRLWCISGILYRDNKGVCEDCVKKAFPLSGIKNKCYRGSLPQSILAQLSFAFYRLLNFFNYVDKLFVLTKFQKEKVLSLGLSPSKVILKPNGLTLKDKKPFLSNRSGYVFVGRLEKNKGIHIILDTWKSLPQSYHLTIIGNSPDIQEIQEKWQSDNIIFRGKCSHKETMRVITQSRYVLQTSLLYETFGLTMIEAFACGTPVIGFNIGTRPEFVKDSHNGFLCTPETLRDTIIKSDSFPRYRYLQENALASYEKYKIEKITQQQIAIYKKILTEP